MPTKSVRETFFYYGTPYGKRLSFREGLFMRYEYYDDLVGRVAEMLRDGRSDDDVVRTVKRRYDLSDEAAWSVVAEARERLPLREWKGGERSVHFGNVMKDVLADLGEFDDGIVSIETVGTRTLVVEIGSMRDAAFYEKKILAAVEPAATSRTPSSGRKKKTGRLPSGRSC